MHVRDDQRLAQDLDHRDRRADARLEAQLDPAGRGGCEELRAAVRDQLLVRRRDVLAAAQQLEHVAADGIDAAHHLGDDGDRRIACDLLEVVGEHTTRRWVVTLLPQVAHERLHDAQSMTRGPLDVIGGVGQKPIHRRTDGAVAEQGDRYVNRRHEPPLRLPGR